MQQFDLWGPLHSISQGKVSASVLQPRISKGPISTRLDDVQGYYRETLRGVEKEEEEEEEENERASKQRRMPRNR
ncbi:hypothetical protein HJFPF1_12015 [Paramyrothecium foliicola]|nr:hypothetical protein HJFPF1_12015 [Paramyrothecium foliicola]